MRTTVNASIVVGNDGIRVSPRFIKSLLIILVVYMLGTFAMFYLMVQFYQQKVNKLELRLEDCRNMQGGK